MCSIRKAALIVLLVACSLGTAISGPAVVSSTYEISGGENWYLGFYGESSSTPVRARLEGLAPLLPDGPFDMPIWTESLAGYCVSSPQDGQPAADLPEGLGVYVTAVGTDWAYCLADASVTQVFTSDTNRIRVDLVGFIRASGGMGYVNEVSYSLIGPGVNDSYYTNDPWTVIDMVLFYDVAMSSEYTLTLTASLGTLRCDEASLCATISCVPAPGALLLGAIGSVVVGWIRRRGLS